MMIITIGDTVQLNTGQTDQGIELTSLFGQSNTAGMIWMLWSDVGPW